MTNLKISQLTDMSITDSKSLAEQQVMLVQAIDKASVCISSNRITALEAKLLAPQILTEQETNQLNNSSKLVNVLAGLMNRYELFKALVQVYGTKNHNIVVDAARIFLEYYNNMYVQRTLNSLFNVEQTKQAELLTGSVTDKLTNHSVGNQTIAQTYNSIINYMVNNFSVQVNSDIEKLFTKSPTGSTICFMYGGKEVTIAITALTKFLKYSGVPLIVRQDEKTGAFKDVTVHQDKINMAYLMSRQSIELNGFKEYSNVKRVVFTAKGKTDKTVFNRFTDLFAETSATTFALKEEDREKYDAARKAIVELLTSNGYTNLIFESAINHGYVIKEEDVLLGLTENAFLHDGMSFENAKKLNVRLEKLVQARDYSVTYKGINVLTASVATPEQLAAANYLDPDYTDEVYKLCQKEAAKVLSTGQLYMSDSLYRFFGTARVTTGSNVGESGMKAICLSGRENMIDILGELYDTAESEFGVGSKYIVQGTNSAKSAEFQVTSMKHVALIENLIQDEQGNFVPCYINYTTSTEDVRVTDSYVTNMYEYVDSNTWSDPAARLASALNDNRKPLMMLILGNASTMEDGKQVDVQINNLLAKGVIREKSMTTETNSQFFSQMDLRDPRVTRQLIDTLFKTNKCEEYKSVVQTQMVRLHNLTGFTNTTEIELSEVLNLVKTLVVATGARSLDSVVGTYIPLPLVKYMIDMFFKVSGYTVIKTGNKSTAIVTTGKLFNDWMNVSKTGGLQYGGVLGAFFKALDTVVCTFGSLEQNDIGFELEFTGTEEQHFNVFSKTLDGELDLLIGKQLNKLRVPGFYGVLVSSAYLENNQIYSARFGDKNSGLIASTRKYFDMDRKEFVAVTATKYPAIQSDSVHAYRSVLCTDAIWDRDTSYKQRFVTLDESTYKVLSGNAIFQTVYIILILGNDTDGDLLQVIALPYHVFAGSVLADEMKYNYKLQRTASSTTALMADNWINKMKDEQDIKFKSKGSAEVVCMKEMCQAALESVQEKSNVAIVTNLQSMLIRHRTSIVEMFEDLKGLNVLKLQLGLKGKDTASFVSYYYDLIIDMTGVLVNKDGMDRIKHEGQALFTRVSDVMLSADMKFGSKLYHTYAVATGMYTSESVYNSTKVVNASKLLGNTLTGVHAVTKERAYESFSFECVSDYVNPNDLATRNELVTLMSQMITVAHGLDLVTFDPLTVIFNKTMKSGSVKTELSRLVDVNKKIAHDHSTYQSYLVMKALGLA